ncbi:hypothetical protein PGUG_04205 [Meyerozyma guilliermondii ATCC 6260]|uniref:Magnesium transporter ALR1 n=1 Tax=Meyerozyma guilliermondii (strain ATCC 6260 / CBS 566 / DSM 6381 / JCM 1539 / NBRC 10279 / NRRL Y-324) TaxID=294746 RepID=A5DLQ4_PICGU|nr:uncharacterized protein PGUG_04205 [Meyerozyma guilliermondii ATCC 6260]EDK40107.2 hypothetical protein PGUG_04205 [Meyerozyma guilliermondii ATCC 6260]
MSDQSSSRSVSPTRDPTRDMDTGHEGLNDHRNQPPSLPIRSNSEARRRRPSDADEELGPRSHKTMLGNLRTEYYLRTPDEEDESAIVPTLGGRIPSVIAEDIPSPTSRQRSRSFTAQLRAKVGKDDSSDKPSGILMKSQPPRRKSTRSNSLVPDMASDLVSPMTKIKTNDSTMSEKRNRRPSRSSIDSDADSHASRSSQETEEDVCFPMLREHIRVKGIDFDEIEEFIKEEREEEEFMRQQQTLMAERASTMTGDRSGNLHPTQTSSAALKYTPTNLLKRSKKSSGQKSEELKPSDPNEKAETNDKRQSDSSIEYEKSDSSASENVKFGGTRINDSSSSLPDRFSFFSSESEETLHAPDLPSMVQPGQSVKDLFHGGDGTWWLDCVCPTDAEMKMLAKAFGIHPLTAEDIRMQETREKVELFRSYYFVCFHTFEPDDESEDYLEPINVYIVVFRDGVLTFHFSPLSHPANVRRRIRQLRDYVDVSSDWICYALIDDITDGFAPVITGIEYEADAIEDSVFVARDLDFSNMLQRIGEARRKVMTLMRLLSGKADVIKMFAKRCQDEAAGVASSTAPTGFPPGVPAGLTGGAATPVYPPPAWGKAQPRADIALYLGDIQDHVITMFQNLLAYEKIFSRSHSNYLAQLQVESFHSNNMVTEMLSKVTLIGTLLVPLNLITGLFGMNVHVPGEGGSNLHWFFGIVGVMVFIIIIFFLGARMWLSKMHNPNDDQAVRPSRRSTKSFGLRNKTKEAARSILSFPNKYE